MSSAELVLHAFKNPVEARVGFRVSQRVRQLQKLSAFDYWHLDIAAHGGFIVCDAPSTPPIAYGRSVPFGKGCRNRVYASAFRALIQHARALRLHSS